MFIIFLRALWRNTVAHKMYSLINIVGLTIGLACCILIMIWVQKELSFDRFHRDSERIFRIYSILTINNADQTEPRSSLPLGAALKQMFPEVESMTRLSTFRTKVKYNEMEFREENIFLAESSFFELFSFPLLKGNRNTVLSAPYSVVITEAIARKYFGHADPLGKMLRFGDGRMFSVTGVAKDPPSNSHLAFDILCSLETLRGEKNPASDNWGAIGYATYVKLARGTDPIVFESKMGRLVEEQIGNRLKKLGVSLGFYLQPLERIHLYSKFDFDESGTGNINYVYLFSGIAFFIMIIACVNYINLATARYAGRAMEVGLRKTLGATRGTLITHFLGETFILTCFATVLALVLSRAGLGLLQSITGQVIDDDIFTEPSFLMLLAAIAILVSLISGSYPALFLSSFQPGVMLKGKIKTGVKASFFRKVLVVGQFSIAIALIIGTLTMFEQMHFVRSENLGFDMDQVLIADYPQKAPVAIETFRAEMANLPGVLVAGLSSAVPAQGINSQNVFPEGRPDSGMQLMQVMDADDNYLPTLGIEIVQGRNFSREMARDDSESALINEAAMAKLDWANPIGKTIEIATRGPDGQPLRVPKRIVGVVKDFHSFSLHQKIEPLLIMNDRANCNLVSIKISSADPVGTLSRIKQKWNELFSGIACDYYFLDESFNRQYQTDERLNQIFSVFAGIAILISCLGLFGLASFITEKRTREVGIRKVLGASFSRIVVMLTGEFSKWVLMANVIAWPVAYFFLNRWLQTFAYRTTIGIGIFLLSGLSALLIALLTVGWQAVRAAAAQPVDSLRYE